MLCIRFHRILSPIRIRIQNLRWIRIRIQDLMTKYLIKIAIYLSLGLHKGRPSYRRTLQPTKEKIHHLKKWNLLIFSSFVGHFCPPGSGSGYGSGSTTLPRGTVLNQLVLVGRLHPQGWVAVSRNTSSDEASEWCCVHDIHSVETRYDF
jgi:hypothetical protein